MARARNIKPGFYKNEELAELDIYARFLYPGLWMLADREGRLEDRPKRIKAEILPYDNCDIDGLLDQLADKQFIVRYEVEGNRYIEIPKFTEHQNPHHREAQSLIPAPNKPEVNPVQGMGECGDGPRHEQDQPTKGPGLAGGKVEDSPGLSQEKPDESRAESLFSESPISDSGFLNPESKTHSSKRDRFDPAPTVALYHSLCPSLPAVVKITDQRKTAIKSALARYGEQDIKTVFEKAEASDFLTGRAGGDRSWSCGFDWLLKPANTVKVLEGIYDNKKSAAGKAEQFRQSAENGAVAAFMRRTAI